MINIMITAKTNSVGIQHQLGMASDLNLPICL